MASGQIACRFLEIIADGRIAIAHRGPRDVAGWSRAGGSGWSGLAPASIDGARCRPATGKLRHAQASCRGGGAAFRDSLNGPVSASLRLGCNGGGPWPTTGPPNDERQIAEPEWRVKLTLQPRTLGGEIRIIDHLAVSVLTAPMGSATSPFIVDDAIVGLPQPLTEALNQLASGPAASLKSDRGSRLA